MAASTITRTGVTLVNDTGTPSAPVGDGTLLNNAWVQTFLDRIDALFTGALTIGGVFTAEAFGTHTFSASGTGFNAVVVRNPTAGTANGGALYLGNDSSASRGQVRMHSTTFAGTGVHFSDGLSITTAGVNGICLSCSNTADSAVIRLSPNGDVSHDLLMVGGATDAVSVMANANTESAILQLGKSRIGNGYAYIDFIGDTTYINYGLRIIRGNGGEDSASAIYHRGVGSLQLITEDAGAIEFHTTNTKRGEFRPGGHFVLPELTTNPGTSDLTADAAVAIYTKADKLVFAYNNSGTMTYISLDLDGSDTTWTHSTSAP